MDPNVVELYGALPEDDRAGADARLLWALAEPTATAALDAEISVLERLAAAKPHVVHQKSVLRKAPDRKRIVDKAWDGTVETGRLYSGLEDCPDCTRGLSSRGYDFICLQLPRSDLRGCHEGCIVACGRER